MYTVVCDNCGVDANEHEEIGAWGDKEYALDSAMESDWTEIYDKHYCNNCIYHDDNDNLVIKKFNNEKIKQNPS